MLKCVRLATQIVHCVLIALSAASWPTASLVRSANPGETGDCEPSVVLLLREGAHEVHLMLADRLTEKLRAFAVIPDAALPSLFSLVAGRNAARVARPVSSDPRGLGLPWVWVCAFRDSRVRLINGDGEHLLMEITGPELYMPVRHTLTRIESRRLMLALFNHSLE